MVDLSIQNIVENCNNNLRWSFGRFINTQDSVLQIKTINSFLLGLELMSVDDFKDSVLMLQRCENDKSCFDYLEYIEQNAKIRLSWIKEF